MNKKLLLSLLFMPVVCLSKAPTMVCDIFTEKNKRPYQEDRFVYRNVDFSKGYNPFYAGRKFYQGKFFAVYDGHGGDQTSSYLQSNFHKYLRSGASLANAFNYAFAAVEKYALEHYDDGSTVVAAFINKENRLCFAWTGDSHAVLEKNGAVVLATEDHKPDAVKEKKRIEVAGGSVYFQGVYRVNGLAVSRSIGDRDAKSMGEGQIIAAPEYKSYQLTEDNSFFVMASDGLWDVMTNEEVVEEVARYCQLHGNSIGIAQHLTQLAIARDSRDNITIIVTVFDWK